MNGKKPHSGFRKLSFITLVSVYLLILAGGIVRSTGSGMGCPDWPKCFGKLVPPTDASELPDDYKDYYANYRHEKNVRFARYLQMLGMNQKADRIVSDTSILVEADFNVYKTWTEYVNRLMGALVGLLIFAMMIFSFSYWKNDKAVTLLCMLNVVAVGFQGWIGSIVVSTNLMPWMITFHMIMALLIVLLLIYINFRIRKHQILQKPGHAKRGVALLAAFCLAALGLQIVFGTQVREAIDIVASQLSHSMRETWISRIGFSFIVHRSFSLVVLALHTWLLLMVLKYRHHSALLKKIGIWVMVLLLVEVFTGVIMAYFGIPSFIQPLHLLLSMLSFGVLYYLYLNIANSAKNIAIGSYD
jgi:cytochrome c oxidase assembly protein subunit 15